MEGLRHDGLTRWQEAFFLLLRCGLWQQTPVEDTLWPLTDDEWQRVYEESRRQTVQGLLYRGFQQLPEPLFPPPAVLMRWLADIEAVEQNYRRSVEATTRSWQLLCQSGQQPVLQKGLAVGLFYEHPEERVYGDVDWYVSVMEAAAALLQREGVAVTRSADRSLTFVIADNVIELHPLLTDLQRHRSTLDQLVHENGTIPLTLPDGTTVRTASPLLTLVMLQAHILKHVVTVGIGLRQFCDLARAYHRLHHRIDSDRLNDYYRRLGLQRWTTLAHAFLHTYLGLPVDELPSAPKAQEKACQRLLSDILRGGNFGQHTTAWQSAHSHHLTKLHTIKQILRNLPFALRYAPGMTISHVCSLIRNQ